jgi:uncharacterized membrane protein YeaQ/YmgE (transglycosylase-associated protein family)
MNNNNTTIESLVKGGVIGALLGAILSKDKEEGIVFGAILGAAVNATLKANKNALKTDLPIYIENNGKIYAVYANGKKTFIKEVENPVVSFPEEFSLK